MGTLVRYAEPHDTERLTEIYNWYILNTSITFDTKPKTAEERADWLNGYTKTGPYRAWVAEVDDVVQGCATSSQYRMHPAFNETIEVGVYLAHDYRGKGLGSLLYERLFQDLRGQNLHLAVSGIAIPNEASVALHRKFGFTEVGVFDEYATKNGRRISSIWMQKRLREY